MDRAILFYDGDCGLCNRTVQFVLRHESHAMIQFCPLGSEFQRQFFEEHGEIPADLSTVYFYTQGTFYTQSDAVLQLVRHLRWYCKPLYLGVIVPKFLRDQCYHWVAKNRKKWIKAYCVVPDSNQRKRFLS